MGVAEYMPRWVTLADDPDASATERGGALQRTYPARDVVVLVVFGGALAAPVGRSAGYGDASRHLRARVRAGPGRGLRLGTCSWKSNDGGRRMKLIHLAGAVLFCGGAWIADDRETVVQGEV